MSDPVRVPRRLVLGAAALAAAGTAWAKTADADDTADLAAIMQRYAAALRSGDVEALVGLYAPDGVFMREGFPPATGTDALRASYRTIFATLKIDLGFDIKEVEVAGDMAWLRLISRGHVKILATGSDAPVSFNGLAVFRRLSGGWKIRAYLFASDTPGSSTPR